METSGRVGRVMAQGETGESKEQSMEEILQSIKRIIAEESDAPEGEEAPAAPMMAAPRENGARGSDVLELTDMVAEGEAPAPKPKKAAAPSSGGDILESIDSLLSDDAARSSSAALRALNTSTRGRPTTTIPSPQFRSGTTVEDLMIEAMRPMLKEWLDSHLPHLVERLVEKEIRKLSNQ